MGRISQKPVNFIHLVAASEDRHPLAHTGYASGTMEGLYDMQLVNIGSLGILYSLVMSCIGNFKRHATGRKSDYTLKMFIRHNLRHISCPTF